MPQSPNYPKSERQASKLRATPTTSFLKNVSTMALGFAVATGVSMFGQFLTKKIGKAAAGISAGETWQHAKTQRFLQGFGKAAARTGKFTDSFLRGVATPTTPGGTKTFLGKVSSSYLGSKINFARYINATKIAKRPGAWIRGYTHLFKTSSHISVAQKVVGGALTKLTRPLTMMPSFYVASMITGEHRPKDFHPLNPVGWAKDYGKYAKENYGSWLTFGLVSPLALGAPGYAISKVARTVGKSQIFQEKVFAGLKTVIGAASSVNAAGAAIPKGVRAGFRSKSFRSGLNKFKGDYKDRLSSLHPIIRETTTRPEIKDFVKSIVAKTRGAGQHEVLEFAKKHKGLFNKRRLLIKEGDLPGSKAITSLDYQMKGLRHEIKFLKWRQRAMAGTDIKTGKEKVFTSRVLNHWGLLMAEKDGTIKSPSKTMTILKELTGQDLVSPLTEKESTIFKGLYSPEGFKKLKLDRLRLFNTAFTASGPKDGLKGNKTLFNVNPWAVTNSIVNARESLGQKKIFGLNIFNLFLPPILTDWMKKTPYSARTLVSETDLASKITLQNGKQVMVGKNILSVENYLGKEKRELLFHIPALENTFDAKYGTSDFKSLLNKSLNYQYGRIGKVTIGTKPIIFGDAEIEAIAKDKSRQYLKIGVERYNKTQLLMGIGQNSTLHTQAKDLYYQKGAVVEGESQRSVFGDVLSFFKSKFKENDIYKQQIRHKYSRGYFDYNQEFNKSLDVFKTADALGRGFDKLKGPQQKALFEKMQISQQYLAENFQQISQTLNKAGLDLKDTIQGLGGRVKSVNKSANLRKILTSYFTTTNDALSPEQAASLADRQTVLFDKIMQGDAKGTDLLYFAHRNGKNFFNKPSMLDKKSLSLLYEMKELNLDKNIKYDDFRLAVKNLKPNLINVHKAGLHPDYTVFDDLQNAVISDTVHSLTTRGPENFRNLANNLLVDSMHDNKRMMKKALELVNIGYEKRELSSVFSRLHVYSPRDILKESYRLNAINNSEAHSETIQDYFSGLFQHEPNQNPWFVGLDTRMHEGNFGFFRNSPAGPRSGITFNIAKPQVIPEYIRKGVISDKVLNNLGERYNVYGSNSLLLDAPSDLSSPFSYASLGIRWATTRFNEVVKEIVPLGIDTKGLQTGQILTKMLTSRILPAAGIVAGASMVDDLSSLFIHGGISGSIAKVAVNTDLGIASLRDKLGITKFAQHLEGLMPGLIDSPAGQFARIGLPLFSAAKFAGLGMSPWVVGGIGAASTILGLSSSPTKSAKDLKDEYTGKKLVPIRKSRFWSLSSSPFEGTKIESYIPNWYARLNSKYKLTSDVYGNPLESFVYKPLPLIGTSFGDLFDVYHNEKKFAFRRPSHFATPLFHDVPIIGPALSSAIGSIFKPPISLSPIDRYEQDGVLSDIPGQGMYSQKTAIETLANSPKTINVNNANKGAAATHHPAPFYNPYKAGGMVGEQLYRGFTEPAGLIGWEYQTIMGVPGMKAPLGGYLQNEEHPAVGRGSAEKFSMSHSWWNESIGGMIGSNEGPRRLFPQDAFKKNYVDGGYNSTMPTWLPMRFRRGDVFSIVKAGEIRLPGSAYRASHSVKEAYPISAKMLGFNADVVAQYQSGIAGFHPLDLRNDQKDEYIKSQILMDLSMTNKIIKTKALMYDPINDIDGSVDAVIQSGSGKIPVTIKRVTKEQYEKIGAEPLDRNLAEVQFYMNQMNAKAGKIIYVNDDYPELQKTLDIEYNPMLYRDMIATVRTARHRWQTGISRGKGYIGNEFSWPDRLMILADVAPYSDQYKEALQVVGRQRKARMLDKIDTDKIQQAVKIRKNRARPLETYERRFRVSQILHPERDIPITNSNDYIKAAAEYPLAQRIIGSMHEYITHNNNLINRKFMNKFSTEEYLRYKLAYGKKAAYWEHPVSQFLEPQFTMPLGAGRDIISSVGSGATQLGMFMGVINPAYAAGGAVVGAAESLVGYAFSPKMPRIKKEEKFIRKQGYMDYMRNMSLYQQTQNPEYAQKIKENILNVLNQEEPSYTDIVRATPVKYKSVVGNAMLLSKEEQTRIADILPNIVGDLLRKNMSENIITNPEEIINNSYLPSESMIAMPENDYKGYQINVLRNEGLDYHDFGLGYGNQIAHANQLPTKKTSDMKNEYKYDFNATQKKLIENTIKSFLSKRGIDADIMVTITKGKRINVNIL